MKNIVTVILVGMLAMAAVAAKPNSYFDPISGKQVTTKEYKQMVKESKKYLESFDKMVTKYNTMIVNWSNIDDSVDVVNWKEDLQNSLSYYFNLRETLEASKEYWPQWDSLTMEMANKAYSNCDLVAALLQLDKLTARDYKQYLDAEYSYWCVALKVEQFYYGKLLSQR
jgi:hypothetical protein